jgi:hypothetical protein
MLCYRRKTRNDKTRFNPFLGKAKSERLNNFENSCALYLWRHMLHFRAHATKMVAKIIWRRIEKKLDDVLISLALAEEKKLRMEMGC